MYLVMVSLGIELACKEDRGSSVRERKRSVQELRSLFGVWRLDLEK
jgi:hypothetical protein